MDLLKRSSGPHFSRVFCPGDGFSKSIFRRFTKTTEFFTKILGFKGKGSWITSEVDLGGGRLGIQNCRGQKINANFFVQSFSKTLRVMDVRAENRGRPHQKVRFPVAPVVGRNFLTQGHPGVRVRNVRGKSGPKSLCLCCFFFPDLDIFENPVETRDLYSANFQKLSRFSSCWNMFRDH